MSKYQIYAATWTKKYAITSKQLINLVNINKDRYENMAMDGTDIADFDSISFMKNKELNLFEIAFALGKELGKNYPHLFTTKNEIKDVDSLGFSVITACLGQKNSNSKNLYSIFDKTVGDSNVNLFLERILQSVETVQRYIGKFNRFKLNTNSEAGPLHTEFQIISLIGNAFIARYATYQKDANDRLTDFTLSLQKSNKTWDAYEQNLKDNAWQRYCLDILNARWKGSGDKKLDTVILDSNYYTQKIHWNDYEAAITQWYTSTKLERNEIKRVAIPQEAEKTFLAMLYLPIFSAQDQADHSKYDVEHLAPKNFMKKCLERYNGNLALPISSVGNLCLLPQKENRSKKDNTLYSDSNFLAKSTYSLQDLETKFTFTVEDDLKWIEDHTLSKDDFAKNYIKFIDTRFAKMIDSIKNNYFN